LKLRVEAEIRPTEDQTKVEAAVKNIFPTLDIRKDGKFLVGESNEILSLDRLHYLLRVQMILDSARSVMHRGKHGNVVRFMLNKQVAMVAKLSFTEGESPLGPIVVTLEATDIDRLVDYLAPRTKEGRPIREITY
jgi:predicted RNA binding protein with dsRBD fold (UPF0201 family)